MKKTVSIKENRIFRSLYARGKSHGAKTVVMYVQKNRLKDVNRLGITVSVKLGGAVVRNRTRRRIREAYRLSENMFREGLDIVIVARSKCVDAPFDTIVRDILGCAGRLSLIKEKADEKTFNQANQVLPEKPVGR